MRKRRKRFNRKKVGSKLRDCDRKMILMVQKKNLFSILNKEKKLCRKAQTKNDKFTMTLYYKKEVKTRPSVVFKTNTAKRLFCCLLSTMTMSFK